MLPIGVSDIKLGNRGGFNDGKLPELVRRLSDFQQMDFEAGFDQVLNILSLNPDVVYTTFYYRKQTKNQWARDDPAFLVIQACFVIACSLAYAIAFRHPGFWGYLWNIFYSLCVDWLLVGILFASLTSFIANKYLKSNSNNSNNSYHNQSDVEVEWLYAFDVHMNSFLCSFMVTYVFQYFLLPILISRSIVSCILSNTLYALAFIWYCYITHLGYRTLPFLSNTQTLFWYPIVVIVLLWILSILLTLFGLRVNATRIALTFHFL